MEKENKKSRLEEMGTAEFFEDKKSKPESPLPVPEKSGGIKVNEINYPMRSNASVYGKIQDSGEIGNIQNVPKEKSSSFSYTPEKSFEEVNAISGMPRNYGPNPNLNLGQNRVSDFKEMDPYKEKLLEGFFRPETKLENYNQANKFTKENVPSKPSSGFAKKAFLATAVALLVAAVCGAAYLFLPKAVVTVSVKNAADKFNLEAKADTNTTSVGSSVIPAKIFEKEDTATYSFKATGGKSSSGSVQKAKGKITIYNNYNQDSQQLVATTRFLTSEGKLFRLVKGVTVPGMSGNNPGSIEADVTADQPGAEYNINASEFKIPGFEGGPKYDKFYAKSTESMTGGGDSASGSGIAKVSQSDIDNAKKDAEAKIGDQIIEEIKNEIGAGYVMLSGASEKTILESASLSRLNEVAGNFDYKVKAKVKAIVFSESDLKKIAADTYNSSNQGGEISDYSPIKISYADSAADFGAGTISINSTAEVPSSSGGNWDEFKGQILGKNDDQIKEIMKQYPQIETLNIDYWPNFMSQKIPRFGSRVEIKTEDISE